MQKWMPIKGDFSEDNESIIFKGSAQLVEDPMSKSLSFQPASDGIVLFENMILTGTIETNVKFDKFYKNDFAQIIFNYQSDYNYMCAGITNSLPNYGFYINNGGQLNTVHATGLVGELSMNEFHIVLRLIGSFLELYVNEIKVLTSAIPPGMSCAQVGIWVKSEGKVTISDFKTDYKHPEAFIVSQFGDYYDVLYDEVIKPVCESLNYNPIRGDEVASCTLILNDIITSIRNASVIIADITPDNPNVFYEVGYAHALAKPTILLCEKGIRDKLPFDVSGFRTVFYDNSIGGKRQIEEKLKEHLQSINYLPIM